MHHKAQPRAGFTMRQLLIVILVTATLVGLLIPAIQGFRLAQVRAGSTEHLKQIGLAAIAFQGTHNRIPFNGSGVAVGVFPYSLSAVANQPTSGSWGFQIAPYIDQKPMFTAGFSNEGIPAYLCPARARPSTSNTPAAGAATPPWSDYVLNPWLNNFDGKVAAPDAGRSLIVASPSNLVLFGHGQVNPADYTANTAIPGYLDTVLIGGTTATALSSDPAIGPVTFARDSAETRTDAARGFGSPFAEGCLMSMCDGTVRMFPYSIGVGSFDRWKGSPYGLASFLIPWGGGISLPDT